MVGALRDAAGRRRGRARNAHRRDLPLLTAAERRQLLVEWNGTGRRAYPRTALCIELFEAQAARTPDAVAVVSDAQLSSPTPS